MKKIRLAINGFGRIGRLFLREASRNEAIEVVAVNDLGDLENLAYLLKYDSVYRTFPGEIKTRTADGKNYLVVNGQEIIVLQEKDPAKLPWGAMNIDVAVESTGLFESFEKAGAHLTAGAKRVVISAPAKDDESASAKTILLGVNDKEFGTCNLTSNGSCTTNATAPVVAVLAENPGIIKAALSTIHGYTATQSLTDSPAKGKDFRRGRAAAQNISPSTTGAAIAVTRVLPDLKGKFDGVALRVPVITGSLVDLTFLAKRKTTKEEINDILKKAAASPRWQGIIKTTEDQIVSSDVIGEPYAAIVDLKFTQVIDGDLVKVFSWYDNEFGYVSTLIGHVLRAAAGL